MENVLRGSHDYLFVDALALTEPAYHRFLQRRYGSKVPKVVPYGSETFISSPHNILTMETIQKRVADHFQIRHSDMTSKRRPNNIAIPRQIERAFPANAAADKGMTSVSIRRELQERRSEGVESFSQRDAKDESVDIFNRQWTEQERVNGAEDRRGRADAESQRRNRNRAERGLLKQNPRTVTEVVP